MVDYCQQCVEDLFGPSHESGFLGLCGPEGITVVLCEGCGPIAVDDKGRCVSENCLRGHRRGIADSDKDDFVGVDPELGL